MSKTDDELISEFMNAKTHEEVYDYSAYDHSPAHSYHKLPIDKKYHTITDECWIHFERSAYILGRTEESEKIEAIRAEVENRMEALERLRGQAKAGERYGVAQMYVNQYEELARTLNMIIDKHLKP
jgi:hypothetical protein